VNQLKYWVGKIIADGSREQRVLRVFDGDRLMNRLLKAAGMPTILYRTKAPSSFVALSNIESFVAACKAFGVPETSLFQPSDLVDGRKGPLLYVLNCINQLGLIVRNSLLAIKQR